jgi:hypothetical protein
MEVGQGPNWGCSAKENKITLSAEINRITARCLSLVHVTSDEDLLTPLVTELNCEC